MKVVFDENVFNDIDHFHPNFDESVPNLHTVTRTASGRLGQALVMRQSTVAFERISCPMCSRSSLLESGTLFLRVFASGNSCSRCVWVLISSWVQRLVQKWMYVPRQYSVALENCALKRTSPFSKCAQSMLRLQCGFAQFALENAGLLSTSFTG